MPEEITYQGNGTVRVRVTPVEVKEARIRKFRKGDTIRRGEIPDDAFDYLASLPSWGGDLDAYREARARRWGPKPKDEPEIVDELVDEATAPTAEPEE